MISVHTPVASFQAMTWSCGSTRARAEFRIGGDALAQPAVALADGVAQIRRRGHRRAGREVQRQGSGTRAATVLGPVEVVLVEADDLQHRAVGSAGPAPVHEPSNCARVALGRHSRTRRLRRDREPIDAPRASRATPTPASRPRRGSPRSCSASTSAPSSCSAGLPPLSVTHRGAPPRSIESVDDLVVGQALGVRAHARAGRPRTSCRTRSSGSRSRRGGRSGVGRPASAPSPWIVGPKISMTG